MIKIISKISLAIWCLLSVSTIFAYSHQDTLRGSNGRGRAWWDVQQYYLYVSFDTANKSIQGLNTITFNSWDIAIDSMQIDLQEPMILDSAVFEGKQLKFVREGNVYWLLHKFTELNATEEHQITLYYHGKPRHAKMPPWDGGFIWTKDSTGKPWISVACQGLGASSWWPCKDFQADEPDKGMTISLYVPYGLAAISNGLYRDKQDMPDSSASLWVWQVQNPINTYDVSFYIGDYIGWPDKMKGESGDLQLNFYALRYHEAQAKKQFAVVKDMINCFEHWMGPYPFYKDGYKIVEAPFLGMEHQSAIAYGNQYKMGYRGEDRSGTGIGLDFDFIIVHESGHEWFGNSITAYDIADNWIHEGLTTYTEALFVECQEGKEKAFEYTRGQWKNISNHRQIIGDYGVNDAGPGDKYDKGSAIIHMIRIMMDDDEAFRQLLRDINKEFYHSFVSTAQIEQFIINKTDLKLKPFFEQYLRTTKIPELEWYVKKKRLYFRFNNVVDGFSLPIRLKGGKRNAVVQVDSEWDDIDWKSGGFNVTFSKDFLIKSKP